MSKVFVVDTNKQPLNPVLPGYARWLLTQGKAAVLNKTTVQGISHRFCRVLHHSDGYQYQKGAGHSSPS